MATVTPINHPDQTQHVHATGLDWSRIAYLTLLSRAIDDLEETELLKSHEVLYQFSARGHDMAQIILASMLDHAGDAASGYYRSRPFLLALGLDLEDAIAGPMMRSGGMSDGRDIGVVFNLPQQNGRPCFLPMSGGVGAQYTPVSGWAESIVYKARELGDSSSAGAIGVALGGDASTATSGFWAALNNATTRELPMLFYIEDNGYGISVPSEKQTPGGNIAQNLAAFNQLLILDGDGCNPQQAAINLASAIQHIRAGHGPALVRLTVPRLAGHSGQDTQKYKSQAQVAAEQSRDPLPRLQEFVLAENLMTIEDWEATVCQASEDVRLALANVRKRPLPDPQGIKRFVFSETDVNGKPELQQQGGLWRAGHVFPPGTCQPQPKGERINMLTAIRRTLDVELAGNPKLVVFGEDVGPKGGVHAATLGLQDTHGEGRVFDTSLSEEGIIGRAVGMAAAGLMPVPEIQFRKYADPAEEQLNDCGTMRWRTANRFAAPMVVRIPGGFFKVGDPWHSQANEVKWLHSIGWQLAMPSNAQDAVGLLRTAMRDNNPTIFFEHRSMLDSAWARRPWPGDDYVIPFGSATTVREGDKLTVVTWGAMVPRCDKAADSLGGGIEVIDLRTLSPWDRDTVVASVKRTHRCLIVHEDNITAGFGAEITAYLTENIFFELDAPPRRLAMPDVPSPHNPKLMDAVVPNGERITAAMQNLLGF
ncbi:MAG: transketolase C-terminal domain-containing protein [Gammaproteobacteria bacterium]|nr:MAG: transketolase C-terminal domain-containing protein [Gammaproteobacteria bacterium]